MAPRRCAFKPDGDARPNSVCSLQSGAMYLRHPLITSEGEVPELPQPQLAAMRTHPVSPGAALKAPPLAALPCRVRSGLASVARRYRSPRWGLKGACRVNLVKNDMYSAPCTSPGGTWIHGYFRILSQRLYCRILVSQYCMLMPENCNTFAIRMCNTQYCWKGCMCIHGYLLFPYREYPCGARLSRTLLRVR